MLSYDELKETEHPFNGIPISTLNLAKIESHENITVGEVKKLFENGQLIVPLRQDGNIIAVVTPNKFLNLVLLKKL